MIYYVLLIAAIAFFYTLYVDWQLRKSLKMSSELIDLLIKWMKMQEEINNEFAQHIKKGESND